MGGIEFVICVFGGGCVKSDGITDVDVEAPIGGGGKFICGWMQTFIPAGGNTGWLIKEGIADCVIPNLVKLYCRIM